MWIIISIAMFARMVSLANNKRTAEGQQERTWLLLDKNVQTIASFNSNNKMFIHRLKTYIEIYRNGAFFCKPSIFKSWNDLFWFEKSSSGGPWFHWRDTLIVQNCPFTLAPRKNKAIWAANSDISSSNVECTYVYIYILFFFFFYMSIYL